MEKVNSDALAQEAIDKNAEAMALRLWAAVDRTKAGRFCQDLNLLMWDMSHRPSVACPYPDRKGEADIGYYRREDIFVSSDYVMECYKKGEGGAAELMAALQGMVSETGSSSGYDD